VSGLPVILAQSGQWSTIVEFGWTYQQKDGYGPVNRRSDGRAGPRALPAMNDATPKNVPMTVSQAEKWSRRDRLCLERHDRPGANGPHSQEQALVLFTRLHSRFR
jgi:hypothetical protein